MPDLVPPRPITGNLTDLSWLRPRGSADADLASAAGIDCLSPDPAAPDLRVEFPVGAEMADGQVNVRTWDSQNATSSLASPLPMPGDVKPLEGTSPSAGVTDVTR